MNQVWHTPEQDNQHAAGSLDSPVALLPFETDRVSPSDSNGTISAGDQRSSVREIKDLPKEVGVMLVSVGVLGFVLPGVMGTPALIAGGLVLWPGAFGRIEEWLRRRNPNLYDRGTKQLGRFLDDLERRYPDVMER
jgi:hypothetical protein